ncbi:spore cortex biosynthesis protein YabQ [Salirhabdus sp. Marseille-P4669]|uniref:spore cortex biosynthesis protein YabQ n=1 Tax=Salirhabdus sp. Marseille-P4669 TaxID=2042310 RepID=UPI000C7C2880|nr:spore cortex biosynthesis protein YabQ [Salirhabdus sp. Marseille-P4669]
MSLTLQFTTMITMFLCGVYIGVAVDTFNRIHRRKKRSGFFLYANEILFWILQGLILFYILFLINHGELRLYIWLAILLGYVFYQSILRVWYLKSLEYIIQWIVTLTQFLRRLVNRLIVAPVKWIFQVATYVLTIFWSVVIWILILPWKLFRRPILFIWGLIQKRLPKNTKKYILPFGRFYSKIKNTINKWWKRIFASDK